MIERFFLPNGAVAMQQLINPMSGSALQALQDIDQRERPAIQIAQRHQEQMHVIRHDHRGIDMNAWCGLWGRGPAPSEVEWGPRPRAVESRPPASNALKPNPVQYPVTKTVQYRKSRTNPHPLSASAGAFAGSDTSQVVRWTLWGMWGGRPRPPKPAA